MQRFQSSGIAFGFTACSSRILALALSVVSCMTLAATSPSTSQPGSWGINVHNLYHGSALHSIGTQWVRIAVRWEQVEKIKKGNYDWSIPDKELGYYQENGFHIVAMLAAEKLNPLYQNDVSNKAAISQAVAQWMASTAKHFSTLPIIWEIGNEPEVFPMGGYWNDPQTYAQMARAAAGGIKKNSQGKVAALAMGWMDKTFATRVIQAGLLADGNIDYLSFHGYHRTNIAPESGLAEDIAWLKTTASAAPHGATAPDVIDTETGYAILPFGSTKGISSWRLSVYSESTQAAYLARHFIEEINLGLPVSIWYKDMNGENAFSLWYTDEKDPKGLRPMGKVFKTLSNLLPENPSVLKNGFYAVSIQPDDGSSSLKPQLFARSFFHTNPEGKPELVVAVWNGVESFEGKILSSRTFVGAKVTEDWRNVTASDAVTIPSTINIAQLSRAHVTAVYQVNLLDGSSSVLSKTKIAAAASGTTLAVDAAPTPTVLRVVLDSAPNAPSEVRVK
jgi:hypothetical protein